MSSTLTADQSILRLHRAGRAESVRRLSGFKPTGRLHLGNFLGAVRPMIEAQDTVDSVVMIADLHALTVEHDPQRLRQLTAECWPRPSPAAWTPAARCATSSPTFPSTPSCTTCSSAPPATARPPG